MHDELDANEMQETASEDDSVGSLEDFVTDAIIPDTAPNPTVDIDPANIVSGKRIRKPVRRYVDRHYLQLILSDVPPEEVPVALGKSLTTQLASSGALPLLQAVGGAPGLATATDATPTVLLGGQDSIFANETADVNMNVESLTSASETDQSSSSEFEVDDDEDDEEDDDDDEDDDDEDEEDDIDDSGEESAYTEDDDEDDNSGDEDETDVTRPVNITE